MHPRNAMDGLEYCSDIKKKLEQEQKASLMCIRHQNAMEWLGTPDVAGPHHKQLTRGNQSGMCAFFGGD